MHSSWWFSSVLGVRSTSLLVCSCFISILRDLDLNATLRRAPIGSLGLVSASSLILPCARLTQ